MCSDVLTVICLGDLLIYLPWCVNKMNYIDLFSNFESTLHSLDMPHLVMMYYRFHKLVG